MEDVINKLHSDVQQNFGDSIKKHLSDATPGDFGRKMEMLLTEIGNKSNNYFTCIQQPGCDQACQQACFAKWGDAPTPGTLALDDGSRIDVSLLSTFRKEEAGVRSIGNRDRIALVCEARELFLGFYAHLDLKGAMLAVDPVKQCDVLLREIERRPEGTTDHYCDLDFFHDLLRIFVDLRDAHTSLTLPTRYSELFAQLPFTVEEYYVKNNPDDLEPHTHVTAVAEWASFTSFQPGVEILSWNDTPICRKISDVGHLAPGATRAARRRMATEMLTSRWLGQMLMPEEDAVTIKYKSLDGDVLSQHLRWHVYKKAEGADKYLHGPEPQTEESHRFWQGVNRQGLELQRARYRLFKRPKPRPRDKGRTAPSPEQNPLGAMVRLNTKENIEAGKLVLANSEVGYIRIRNFDADDPIVFARGIARLLEHDLPKEKLIIDLRGNPGGLIPAAELVLQLFTNERIRPANLRFRSTQDTKYISKLMSLLTDWTVSLDRAGETGFEYSAAFPLTTEAQFAKVPSGVYKGRVALLIDAMTYSAADFFAGGFQDNNLGIVIGTDHTTGAGASTRWEHDAILKAFGGSRDCPLNQFPETVGDAQMSVAVQAGTRARGRFRDMPFEGLGVQVDEGCAYELTLNDLVHDGVDLLNFAARKLVEKK